MQQAHDLGGLFALGPWRVRRAGYGVMQLAGDGVVGPPRNRDEALRVLRAVVDIGVDHIDTAEFYGAGTVNELIREALHPYPDGLAMPPGRPFDALLAAMVKAREEGLIDGIGLSNVSLTHLLRAVDQTEIVCVQNLFNLPDQRSADVLTAGMERGIAFVPFCPLGWPGVFPRAYRGDNGETTNHRRVARSPSGSASNHRDPVMPAHLPRLEAVPVAKAGRLPP